MRTVRPLLLSALVVGIAAAILMEASDVGPPADSGRGQATGYGSGPPPLKARDFVINATNANGGSSVLPVIIIVVVAVLVAGIGAWLFLRSRRVTT